MTAIGTTATPQPRPKPGPWHAVPATPPLGPGGVRRVTAVDVTRPGGFDGPLVVQVRGRDVRRAGGADPEGGPEAVDEVLDELRVTLEIEEWSGELVRVEGTDHPGVQSLVGASVRRGYSRAVAGALADDLSRRTLLGSAFEDLGGALLVSGYAPLRRGLLTMAPGTGAQVAAGQEDVCVGWAVGRPLVEVLRTEDVNACPIGPIGPEADDLVPAVSGLDVAPPGADAVTRIRTLDVGPPVDGTATVRAHFRDSYGGDDGPMVMHEYVVHARVGGVEPTIEQVDVEPRVLPWSDCPGAVASAQRIVGMPVAAIAGRARAELSGNETCTHLTSTLRSLTDVAYLVTARA